MTTRPSLPSIKALFGPAHPEHEGFASASAAVASAHKSSSHDSARLPTDTAPATRQSGHLRGGNRIPQEERAKLASEVMASTVSSKTDIGKEEQAPSVLPPLPVIPGEQPLDSSYGFVPVEQPSVYPPTYPSRLARPYASPLASMPLHAESASPSTSGQGQPPLPPSHRPEIQGPHHRSTFPPRSYAPDMHGYYPPNSAMYHYPPVPDRGSSLHAPYPAGYPEPPMHPYHRMPAGEMYPYDPYRMSYSMHDPVEDSTHYLHGRLPPPATSTTRYYPHRPSSPQKERKKRPRRKFQEIDRLYACDWPNCQKAYGTLNHLNAHITMQGHGTRKTHHEFRHLPQHQRTSGRTSITIQSSDGVQDAPSVDGSDVATPGETPTGSPDSSALNSSSSSTPLPSATDSAPITRKRKASGAASTASGSVTHSRSRSANATK